MTGVSRVRRVLMSADTIGGVWTYALDLTRGLTRRGVEVALATMGKKLSPEQSREAVRISNLEVYESTYKLEWMSQPWLDVQAAGDWLLTLENDLSPDVVHLNGYAHGELPWRAPCMVVAHSCVLSWWKHVKRESAPPEWLRYRKAVTKGIQAADFVVAPTRAMMTEVERYYGPVRSSAVIANGRDPKAYRPAEKAPFVLAAGRLWDEAKNISALGEIQDAIDWPIYVAGDHRHPEGKTPDLQNLRLLGVLTPNELAKWYSRASIYCLPARYEPFGLSVLEAALSGCALVLGDIPSLRENWGGAAVFVRPDDAEGLKSRVRDLIARPARLNSLAARARRRAQSFTIERMADSYLSLYSHLVLNTLPMVVAGD